ncbi:phosphate import ATP-binding protein pstB [Striga asiatica]|uniref:Phosphate import ATP-binding protein pstB n=1 Tax=Striga asiatica TaxID=4170 RepID=A0A5A7QAL1_STRAF|nr:phosphate import ATP-binding protein pstB [Striga asiatica]
MDWSKWYVESMRKIVQGKHKLLFNKRQLYRAKISVDSGFGGNPEQCALLWPHASEIRPRVESIGSKAKDKHKGHNVFNENSEISNSNFELGMFLTDMSLFRKTVRQHAIKNGKDVVFSINEITNIKSIDWSKWYVESMRKIVQGKHKLLFNKRQLYRAKISVDSGFGGNPEKCALLWSHASEISTT